MGKRQLTIGMVSRLIVSTSSSRLRYCGVRVLAGAAAEATRSDKDAAVCHTAQGAYESLEPRALDCVVGGISLRLNVNAIQAERVLIDESVDPAVIDLLNDGGLGIRTAIPHCDEQIYDRLLKKIGDFACMRRFTLPLAPGFRATYQLDARVRVLSAYYTRKNPTQPVITPISSGMSACAGRDGGPK